MTADRLILVADDNRDAADALAEILRAQGYRVYTAYDGRQVIEAASEVQPDIVILDIGMPKLTGYEVARVFHRHPEKTRPILIAVTGWCREGDKLRAQVAGFDYHVSKPIDPDSVIELLASLPTRQDAGKDGQ